MGIWVDEKTKIIIQGITGKTAQYHTKLMQDYGSNIVGGVSPGKEGQALLGVPIFNTVEKAVAKTSANTSVVYVPAPFAADAILEAVQTELDLVICITEHIPVMDMIKVKKYMEGKKTRLIGPNSPGIITPETCKIGTMPGYIHQKGEIGVVSRSGTLTYEAVYQLSQRGIGQSTAVGIGGDPIQGTNFIEVLQAFNEDKETKAVVMIGEIGGKEEEKAAKWIRANMKKPVVGYISGETLPTSKPMGQAGAIIDDGKGRAREKIQSMKEAGIYMADKPTSIGKTLVEALKQENLWVNQYES